MISLSFLGTGWIGCNRMEAMLATGKAKALAIFDPNPERAFQAQKLAPDARLVGSLDELLECRPDGVVIATPSALHAEQCTRAFDSGVAVFCQKPLGLNSQEVETVLAAARRADRLLGVDFSYRYSAAMRAVRDSVPHLGRPFAADLKFHNAYGPGAAWFWDPKLSGGGCLIDLGVHLVDLALWTLDFPEVVGSHATLFRDGRPVLADEVEDYALGELSLASGAIIRIACSWNLSTGCDALIEATFHASSGGARMHNENGSFFDFSAHRFHGRSSECLVSPPDDWTGRAAAEWVKKLAAGERYAASTGGLLETAQALDRLYGR